MSRIGKKPIPLPDNVKVAVNGGQIVVESGKNKLTRALTPHVSVKVDAQTKAVVVERKDDSRQARAMHGTTRALIANMIQGVTTGFTKVLLLENAIGWTVTVQGNKVVLKIGFADNREVTFPPSVKVEVEGTNIKISGPEKQAVGQVAAEIRSHREAEPYNGRGFRYVDEVIIRKQGKAFAGAGAK